MKEEHLYTNSDLRREDLAQMLGTNFIYLADAIRECTGGQTLSDFLDEYRVRHAALLLANTEDPIGLVTEMSGFASRSHFNSLFREKYKMTPSEYRKVAKEKTRE
jgi:AraC-like DNA-binding protein